MPGRGRWLERGVVGLGIALAALMLGCAGRLSVPVNLPRAARIPARVFPTLRVASGHERESVLLAQDLVRTLREGSDADVRRIGSDEIAPLRAEGGFPLGSAILSISLRFEERDEEQWRARARTVCGPLGCRREVREYDTLMPSSEAILGLEIIDGPTGGVLQSLELRHLERGRVPETMRERSRRHLARRVAQMSRIRSISARVPFLSVEGLPISQLAQLAREGRWREARRGLEALIRGRAARSLEPPQRARLLYDLSLGRRFDPSSMGELEGHFRAAEAPLVAALRLDPLPRYEEALGELRDHRIQLLLIAEQRAAQEHNFRLRRAPSRPAPPAPPEYTGVQSSP